MEKPKYKVLMHCGTIIDYNLLSNGIYSAGSPKLFPPNTTIDGLIEAAKFTKDMTGDSIVCQEFLDNLSKCELVDCEILIDKK